MELQHQINRAWEHSIQMYQAGRINSERTLQAAMYCTLTANLAPEHYVLCEPTLMLGDYGTVKPDIIVAKGNHVVCVIELKFVPNYFPRFEDDLEKLQVYGANSSTFQLLLDPKTGKFADQNFSFSADCLLIFSVFGKVDSVAVDKPTLEEHMKSFHQRFVPLVHAIA